MITAMHPLFVAVKEFFRDDYIVSTTHTFSGNEISGRSAPATQVIKPRVFDTSAGKRFPPAECNIVGKQLTSIPHDWAPRRRIQMA